MAGNDHGKESESQRAAAEVLEGLYYQLFRLQAKVTPRTEPRTGTEIMLTEPRLPLEADIVRQFREAMELYRRDNEKKHIVADNLIVNALELFMPHLAAAWREHSDDFWCA